MYTPRDARGDVDCTELVEKNVQAKIGISSNESTD